MLIGVDGVGRKGSGGLEVPVDMKCAGLVWRLRRRSHPLLG